MDTQTREGKLPIMEHFYTIQGEGKFTGHAAYFIRTAGCDVGCPFCDVKESWSIHEDQWMSTADLVTTVDQAKIAVITGGEPLLHQLDDLTKKLNENNIRTHIETSGSSMLSGQWDWITLSPKKRKMPLEQSWKAANELKIVISRVNDFKFAEDCADQVSEECLLYLQPEWDKSDDILPTIITYIKKHPKWKMSLQTHKYMDIP
ncbi:MAG: 7-carboxy-7-deazaguanine synthase QueE [Flavobacteriales bacterium]